MESIKKRFKTFVNTSMPAVDEFETQGLVLKRSTLFRSLKVYQDVQGKIKAQGIEPTSIKLVQTA